MKKTYILYHKNCTDGFGAAYSAWKKFQDKAIYIPINYGEPLPEIDFDSIVYVLDFCLKKEEILKIKSHSEIIIYDHHKASIGNIEFASQYRFDLNRSGAKITWDEFFPNQKNELIDYISDKDLALFNLKKCEEIICALESYDRDFNQWNKLKISNLKKEGESLLRFKRNEINVAIEKAFICQLGKYKVPVVNCSIFMGEIAEALVEKFPDYDFCATFNIYKQNNKTYKKWSLRSNRVDLSIVSKEFGGGGHSFAAAFIEEIKENNE